MKTIPTLALSFLFFMCTFTSLAFEVDSTEESSIDFITIEATLSSKIIHFQWDVNAEKQGDFFIIEKSTDRSNWVQLTRVESIANHQERHSYSVSEINMAEALHEYFRISRVDIYGDTTELDVINVNQPILSNLSLIPIQGKVDEEIRLSFDSLILSTGELVVQNMQGEVQFKTMINSEKGYNHYLLQIKNYPPGRYLITIKDEFGNKTSRSLNVFDASRKKRKSKF